MYFQVNNEIVLIFLPKDALAACNYLPQSREKIIAALFKALNSTNSELQEAGEACMRKVSERDMSVCTCVCGVCDSALEVLSVYLGCVPGSLPVVNTNWIVMMSLPRL